jgi:anti-repressor protein
VKKGEEMSELARQMGKRMTIKEVAEATGAAYSTVAAYAQKAGWTENGKQTLLDEDQVAIIVESMKQAQPNQTKDTFQAGLEGVETTQSRALRTGDLGRRGMKELLKLDDKGNQTVSARELHAALEVGRDFSTWIKERIEKYGFVEGSDFSPDSGKSTGGRPSVDYLLTISVAKEIAVVENNAQGRAIRRYLIKVEEAWNTPELVAARALKWADSQLKLKDIRIAELEPKAAFFDQVADSQDALQMRDVAAALNIPDMGRNKIFELLRKKNILDERNVPYREYQDRGYFRVVEQKWTDKEGETHISLKTLVYQRGMDFIRRTLAHGGAA